MSIAMVRRGERLFLSAREIFNLGKLVGLPRPRFDCGLRAHGVSLLFEKGVNARLIEYVNPEFLKGFSAGDLIYVGMGEKASFITQQKNPHFIQIILPKKGSLRENSQKLLNLLWFQETVLIPGKEIEFPTSSNPTLQQFIYFLLTGNHQPFPWPIQFDLSSRYILYRLKENPLRLSCGTIKGIQKEKVFAEAVEFKNGTRGLTLFVHGAKFNGQKLPLISYILFENGHFLKSPRLFPFDLEISQIESLPTTDDLWTRNLIYYFATGKCKPPERKIINKGNIGIYTFEGKQLPLQISSLKEMLGKEVLLEVREFKGGKRGIIIWELTKEGEKGFPLIAHVLFTEGQFLEKSESHLYGLDHLPEENIPRTIDIETIKEIIFLARGVNPPLDREVTIRKGGTIEKSYALRKEEVRRYIPFLEEGEVVIRSMVKFTDGSRGEIYYRKSPQGERLYPIVGYKLFKDGAFLSKPFELPLGLENFSKEVLPSTHDPDVLQNIYFLATGNCRPPRQKVILREKEGKDHLYQIKKPVALYVTWNKEVIAEGVECEWVEFSEGTRGVVYYKKDGTSICSYVLFKDGEFIKKPRRVEGALPVKTPEKVISPAIILDAQVVSTICVAMKATFDLPKELSRKDIFATQDNEWTKKIKKTLRENVIIYIGELQAELEKMGSPLDRRTLKHLVMHSALKEHFDLSLIGSMRDVPNAVKRKRLSSWAANLIRIFYHKSGAIVSDTDIIFTKQEVIARFQTLAKTAKTVKYSIVGRKEKVLEIVYQGYRIPFKIEGEEVKFYERVPKGEGDPAELREAPEIFKADGTISSLAIFTYEKEGKTFAFVPFARGELASNRVKMILTDLALKKRNIPGEIIDAGSYYDYLTINSELLIKHLQAVISEQNFIQDVLESKIDRENLVPKFEEQKNKFSAHFGNEVNSILKKHLDHSERLEELKKLFYGPYSCAQLVDHVKALKQDWYALPSAIKRNVGQELPQGYSRERIPTRVSSKKKEFREKVRKEGIEIDLDFKKTEREIPRLSLRQRILNWIRKRLS